MVSSSAVLFPDQTILVTEVICFGYNLVCIVLSTQWCPTVFHVQIG